MSRKHSHQSGNHKSGNHKFRGVAGEASGIRHDNATRHPDSDPQIDENQLRLYPELEAGQETSRTLMSETDSHDSINKMKIAAEPDTLPESVTVTSPDFVQDDLVAHSDPTAIGSPSQPVANTVVSDLPNGLEVATGARATLGTSLRDARKARDWTVHDVGTRLKLPVRLIARLEKDDYTGMTQGVYLRGYLTSYARLLDVPIDLAERVADSNAEAVPLIATGTTSHSRYLFDRYSVSATYLILTALIVAPAVWLATHGGLEQNLARNLPLDGALVSAESTDHDAASNFSSPAADQTRDATARPSLPVDPPPIISSIASFPSLPSSEKSVTNPAPQDAVVSESADPAVAHRFTLKVTSPSWVEILDANGERVEYGLLPAGTERSYDADGPLSVHLGNATGVEMQADGKPVDMQPYRRANVVRLTLFGPGQKAGDPTTE